MNALTTSRKVVVLVLTVLMIAMAVFAGASANTATVNDAHAKEKGPTIQQKQQMCYGEQGMWICA